MGHAWACSQRQESPQGNRALVRSWSGELWSNFGCSHTGDTLTITHVANVLPEIAWAWLPQLLFWYGISITRGDAKYTSSVVKSDDSNFGATKLAIRQCLRHWATQAQNSFSGVSSAQGPKVLVGVDPMSLQMYLGHMCVCMYCTVLYFTLLYCIVPCMCLAMCSSGHFWNVSKQVRRVRETGENSRGKAYRLVVCWP